MGSDNRWLQEAMAGGGDWEAEGDRLFGYSNPEAQQIGDSLVRSGGATTPFRRGSFLDVDPRPGGGRLSNRLETSDRLRDSKSLTYHEHIGALSTMNPDELEELQYRLYYAGAYSDDVYKEGRLPSGMLDGETVLAFTNVLEISAREAGRGRSMADVLDMMAVERADIVNMAGKAGGGDSDFPVDEVRAPDPKTLEDMVDKISVELLGKKVPNARKQEIVSAISGQVIGQQTKVIGVRDAAAQKSANAKAGVAGPMAPSEEAFNTKLAALREEAKKAGHDISITSGKRTRQEQAKLYAEKPALAAKPGSSNHEFGLAADLKYSSKAAEAWAHQNAARFGLDFPMLPGKSKKIEPWHIELIDAKAQRNTEAYAGVSVNPTEIVQTMAVDQEARTADMVKATNPVGAEAHDAVGKYAMFAKILGGG